MAVRRNGRSGHVGRVYQPSGLVGNTVVGWVARCMSPLIIVAFETGRLLFT